MANNVAARRREFRDFVWNHAEDRFQAKFDRCAVLSRKELKQLGRLLDQHTISDQGKLADSIATAVNDDRTILRRLLQLTGLTRNKIVQDIKGYIRQHDLKVSTSSPEAIFNSEKGVELGSIYLAKQVQRVFGKAKNGVNAQMLEVTNQATWLGYIRQERAKRMGHEAERRLACLFRECGLGFAPLEKAENPLCRDVQIDGMSYDLVCPSQKNARLRVISTVHTANIGQYGESKDDLEIRKAIRAMKTAGDREQTILLAFIDGVGFESNRAGLDGVLKNADEFCQFRTIWKAAVLAARIEGKAIRIALPRDQHERFGAFTSRYQASITSLSVSRAGRTGWVEAGDALLRIS